MNEPSVPEIVSRIVPFAWLIRTTATPGSTAPCASTTRPRSSDVPCWAAAAVADSNSTMSQPAIRNFITDLQGTEQSKQQQ